MCSVVGVCSSGPSLESQFRRHDSIDLEACGGRLAEKARNIEAEDSDMDSDVMNQNDDDDDRERRSKSNLISMTDCRILSL